MARRIEAQDSQQAPPAESGSMQGPELLIELVHAHDQSPLLLLDESGSGLIALSLGDGFLMP
jgi:hypothetical protein